jgi:phospholipid-binding lipoprotein MlaA
MRSRGTLARVAGIVGLLHVLHALPVTAEDAPAPAPADAEAEAAPAAEIADTPDYDPWAPFNEWTFAFNYKVLDRFLMKPLGRAWDWALPDVVQRSLDNAFTNLESPRRLVNHLLQARPRAAGEEVGRFLVNTTAGVVGLIDVADRIGLHGAEADTGQTFGVWGLGPGPYIVLPFLPPLNVRDGIGRGVDGALDPLGYIIPIPLAVSLAMTGTRRVNSRSLQPAAFENVEETVIDLYSSVRNGYLQRRAALVRAGKADSACTHREPEPSPAVEPQPPPEPQPELVVPTPPAE